MDSDFASAVRRLPHLSPRALAAGLCAMVLAAPGCGGGREPALKTGRVSGTIQLDGNPAKDVMVTFQDPIRGIGASATVTNGAYQFDTPLTTGDYTVTVQFSSPPPSAPGPPGGTSAGRTIPRQYQDPATSTLKALVMEGENKLDFQLKR